MKKIIIKIVATILVSLMIMSITYGAVSFGEYVTRGEVNRYYASMSELLNSLSSLDYFSEKFEKNPVLREFKRIEEKRAKEQEEAGR